MKFLAVFVAIAAVAVAFPAAPAVGVPSTVSTWDLNEISEALQNPSTDPALVPYLEQALNELMEQLWNGHEPASVAVPAMDLSSWTLAELDAAITNPETNPALIPYLVEALNQYMSALFAGQDIESITVVTPAGLLPVVSPTPIEVGPAIVDPVVPEIAAPAPAPAASSPLVQIIVNVNQPADVASPVVPQPIIVGPQPVIVVPEPVVVDPIIVHPTPIIPEPIIVGPEPVVVDPIIVHPIIPEPIIVGPEPVDVNPIDVIAVNPPEVNPVDIIAVNPPEVNPIDIISPVPVVIPEGAGVDVGPM